jgi:hypothetical protein
MFSCDNSILYGDAEVPWLHKAGFLAFGALRVYFRRLYQKHFRRTAD